MQPGKSFLKKTILTLVCVVLGAFSLPSMAQTTKWLTSNMPHYYEFNAAENPNQYYWCGHAALKVAMLYKTGTVKTLGSIFKTFKDNSPLGYAKDTYCNSSGVHWCARLQDLIWAARLPKNGGYGRSAIAENVIIHYNSTTFFTAIKQAIDANNPVIVPSNIIYGNAGHFWVVVGYTDWGTPQGSALYLRDVAMSSPYAANADRSVYVQDLYNGSFQGQMLIIK